MCLKSLVGFCTERMCMDFKIKMEGMERGWRMIEMVSKRGKGVWRGQALCNAPFLECV